MFKKFLLVLALLLPFACYGQGVMASAPNAPMVGGNHQVIFFGDSFTFFNDNINNRLRDLVRSLMPLVSKDYHFRAATISSAHLGDLKPILVSENKLRHWDTVVLQGNSTGPISRKDAVRRRFVHSAIDMAKIAHQAGEKVVYFMTWAYRDRPWQTKKLALAYNRIAKHTGGYVAPVGLAFANARQAYPKINLYYVDGKHPSLAGTYLAACVFYSVLYHRSPEGAAPPVGGSMPKSEALALQKVAWQTVQAYQKGSLDHVFSA